MAAGTGQIPEMEHYRKKQSRYIDEECLPNEIRVGSAGKAHDLATRAVHTMRASAEVGVVISASGSHVTKAVTVAELLKRRLQGVHQDTQIKYIRIEDTWEPDMEGLDTLKVTRRIPAISIRLTRYGDAGGRSEGERGDSGRGGQGRSGRDRRKRSSGSGKGGETGSKGSEEGMDTASATS